jgi:glyoxylase-like metal-dependent hydrolase (beta-lactamase superfamily II)
MVQIQCFSFNPFQENTYILFDETKSCVIIDPGCYDETERAKLVGFITSNNLVPTHLLNTHGHIDHVFGNKFISEKYKLGLEMNALDEPVLDSLMTVAGMYNLHAEPSPAPAVYLEEGHQILFGTSCLDIVFTPGHSPGSICFIDHKSKFVIGGDVLFNEGIGRSDLPGGDSDTLLKSIRSKLFVLGDEYRVYSGHGPVTTIGHEKKHNPFLG